MSCKLEAFILNHKAADMLPDTLRHLHRCRLDDRLALIPVTRQLYQEVVATFGEARDDPYPMFFALAPALAELAAQISSASPVLYLEVDVANGIGDQTAVVWHHGQVAYGPGEGRFFVAEALAHFGQLQGLPSEQVGKLGLWRHRFTEDWVQELLAQTAETQREDQLGPLLAMLRDGSKDNPPRGEFPLRYQAVSGLAALGAVAVEPLCLALRDQDSYTRRFAAEALARIGDARAVIPLVAALRESEVYVQRYVAGALAVVGDAQAVEPLRTALDQPRLAREALPALQAVLTRAAGSVSSDELQRVAALADRCYALIEVPDTDGGYLAWNEVEQWLDCQPVKQLAGQELERRGPLYITGGRQSDDGSEAAARQLLLDQPELEFFYIIWLAYSSGSGGYNTFHSLVTDPQSCQAAIQRLCAEQKAISAREIAEIEELPEDDMPYDPALPDGCSVSLCIVLPDKQHYVRIQGQHWNNYGQSHHPALTPDIFDVAYYSDKVRRGDYSLYSVKS